MAGGVTKSLAEFISTSADKRLPSPVRRATSRAYANWIGCALGAVGDSSLETMMRVALELGGAQHASIIGRRDRADVVSAALVNGFAANTLDYDDMHVRTLIHPTGAVVAAAQALAEREHAPGHLLQSAVATGIEVECRLGLALFPAHYNAGWHITATLGTLGAAAAASVVMRLDAARAAYAIGIAATQAAGLRAMLDNPCKSFNIGRAAAAGVLAALLANAGMESAPDAIETKFGLFDVFGHPSKPESITEGLGESYLVSEISLKPYPCGVVIHPLIDACLEMAREEAIVANDISVITITVHPRAVELAGRRRHPDTAINGRFNIYHAAALALTRRSAGIASFDSADIDDSKLAALRDRMKVEADASLRPSQAGVHIRFVSGVSKEQKVEFPSGSPERPLTEEQLREKFIELACRCMTKGSAERLLESCLSLEQSVDMAEMRNHWVS
ncbi:MAG: MmgE/PrpD family protein [Betaproteobacteria bacterium]|nr:MmgE/PrpD family protein [Betaproteobacteria bacterium]